MRWSKRFGLKSQARSSWTPPFRSCHRRSRSCSFPRPGHLRSVAQRLLGSGVRVVSAFHNVGAKKLHGAERAECDVLVFGDDPEARAIVVDLAAFVATRGVDGGGLANSVAAEALTSVLIAINRKYKVPGAGIRITGLPCASEGRT
jgi:predicted dinucleotide-binding enzyme